MQFYCNYHNLNIVDSLTEGGVDRQRQVGWFFSTFYGYCTELCTLNSIRPNFIWEFFRLLRFNKACTLQSFAGKLYDHVPQLVDCRKGYHVYGMTKNYQLPFYNGQQALHLLLIVYEYLLEYIMHNYIKFILSVNLVHQLNFQSNFRHCFLAYRIVCNIW